MSLFAFVRAEKISDLPELGRIASHGRRLDPTGKRRSDPARTPFTPAGSRYHPEDPLNLVAAFHAARAETGAVPYGNAAIGLHLLVGVSPDIIREAGDLHDPANPMNKALIEQAIAWADDVFGASSLLAWRLDLDETGGGVIDLILMPTRVARMNASTEKTIISVHHALEAVRITHDTRTSFAALQTSWAQHAKIHLDARLRRGEPKTETRREHIPPDIYRKMCELTAAQVESDMSAREDDLAELEALAEEAIVAAERARATAENRSAALRTAMLQQSARVQAQVAATVQALALGVRAVLDGDIVDVHYNPVDRRPSLIPRHDLDENAWNELLTALAPGWDAELLAVLEDLLNGRARTETHDEAYRTSAPFYR
jgi:hypothetical protein